MSARALAASFRAGAALSLADAVALLRAASDAYYNTRKALLTDLEFDALEADVQRRDPAALAALPVGAAARNHKATLPEYMGSLDKIRDDDKAVRRWLAKFAEAPQYVLSDKLDGNSALLAVAAGGQRRLYSRGDGVTGQDISWLLAHVRGVPAALPEGTVVRGELLFSKAAWSGLKAKGANARNTAAGIIHSSRNPDLPAARQLEFVAYELIREQPPSPSAGLRALAQAGFTVVPHRVVAAAAVTEDALRRFLLARRAEGPYEVDGVVVTHDAHHARPVGENPKHAFAFKSLATHEDAEVTVTGVEWNVSKDGLLKPTVVFAPVALGGARIGRATGFNAAFIRDAGIGVGARITVMRSGDVIPHIKAVVQRAARVALPEGARWNGSGVDLVQQGDSEELAFKRLEHFATSLKMKGVAGGLLRRMWDAEGVPVRSIPDLLNVTKPQLLAMDGIQSATAEAVLAEVRRIVKGVPCAELMAASNAFGHGFGTRKLTAVLKALPDVQRAEGRVPDAAAVAAVDGVGPKTAQAFLSGLAAFRAFLRETNLSCSLPKPTRQGLGEQGLDEPAALAGMVVVFTGVRDAALEARIEAAGGRVATGVSKQTTLVVAKDPAAATGKVAKARALGVRVVDLAAFAREVGFVQEAAV